MSAEDVHRPEESEGGDDQIRSAPGHIAEPEPRRQYRGDEKESDTRSPVEREGRAGGPVQRREPEREKGELGRAPHSALDRNRHPQECTVEESPGERVRGVEAVFVWIGPVHETLGEDPVAHEHTAILDRGADDEEQGEKGERRNRGSLARDRLVPPSTWERGRAYRRDWSGG